MNKTAQFCILLFVFIVLICVMMQKTPIPNQITQPDMISPVPQEMPPNIDMPPVGSY